MSTDKYPPLPEPERNPPDPADIIAGAIGTSRAHAYDLMREACAAAQPAAALTDDEIFLAYTAATGKTLPTLGPSRNDLIAISRAVIAADRAARIGEFPALPESLEIEWPRLHSEGLGCGVEDRSIHNRYEAAEYGFTEAVERAAMCVPEHIFDADQMRSYTAQAIAAAPQPAAQPESSTTDYIRRIYDYLASTAPSGFADEAFRLPPAATRAQRALHDAATRYQHTQHSGLARQDSDNQRGDCRSVAPQPAAQPERKPTSVSRSKRASLEADGYIVNGVSLMHPGTRQRVLLDDYGFVGWWQAHPERKPLTRDQVYKMAHEDVFLGNIFEIVKAVESAHGIKGLIS